MICGNSSLARGSPIFTVANECGSDTSAAPRRVPHPTWVIATGFACPRPINIGDEDLSHMSNWFDCMRSSNKKTNATVDNRFLHALPVIMAAQSYWQGKRLYYDSAAEQILDRAPTH
jgi:hypothetical protein